MYPVEGKEGPFWQFTLLFLRNSLLLLLLIVLLALALALVLVG